MEEDKNTKTEPTELERMADGITVENPEGGDGKGGVDRSAGSQAGEPAGVAGAGWRTVLPKEFREDAKDSENLSSYLSKLKGMSKAPEETDEDWEKFYDSIGAVKDSADRKKAEAMREAGISTKSATALIQSLQVQALSDEAEGLRKRNAELEEYLEKAKKGDRAFLASLDNGMKAFAKSAPEQFLSAKDRGVLNDPAFVSALYLIGKGSTETALISGTSGAKEKEKIDPLNPYGYK